MRTVGEILKKARREKNLSLAQAEKITKIRIDYLRTLENNDFDHLPSSASARGFLKNYAEFLGLSSESVLAIFRRDFDKQEKKGIVLPGLVKPVGQSQFRWTPKLTLITVIAVFFLGLLGYLGYQYFSLRQQPALEVFSPQEDTIVSAEKIEITGRAGPDVFVSINGKLVLLSANGEFRYQQDLFPGENKIIIEAKNKFNKTTTVSRTITRTITRKAD